MNLNDYQKLAARTIPVDKDKNLRIAEFTLALCEEAGESAGVLKKVIFHHHPFDVDKARKLIGELGDTLWHIAALATEFGITMDEIAAFNLEKLRQRYPNGYSDINSLKRVDVNE
ncbi:MAG: nucleoside triphosphate pyrophosphohydrolase family protein [Bacillota bacterium]|nr:nucleoside triphosphate pyrophosphohydrolase family protein [Bacillota bacterium]